jgi:hypothetical protein
MKYGKDLFFPKGWRGRAGEPGFPAKLEDKAEKNACNSFYFILLNRNKNNSKKDIAIASFIAKKVFLEELEKKKELHTCRSIAIWRAEKYLKKKL